MTLLVQIGIFILTIFLFVILIVIIGNIIKKQRKEDKKSFLQTLINQGISPFIRRKDHPPFIDDRKENEIKK